MYNMTLQEEKEYVEKITQEILQGRRLTEEDDLDFLEYGCLEYLTEGADRIRRELCGNGVNLCSIINGRSGKCSENCKFCAQSAHHHTGIETYDLLDEETVLKDCHHHARKGVHRYSIVTAGKTLEGEELQKACAIYRRMHEETGMQLCASHGLLSDEAFAMLKEAGVENYHANIETSRRYFPNVCTTHTFDDKISCIKRAKAAGLKVCSGGIIGMGETFRDRMDMALTLAQLEIESIPINALIPVKGTCFGELETLSEEEILRSIAMFRFINPTAYIRLAAGRTLMEDSGKKAFLAGANATITGDMLTTSGNDIEGDKKMLTEMGFSLDMV